jgi:succinate dehydrogenase / fumarate reductase membrane anchor subunit
MATVSTQPVVTTSYRRRPQTVGWVFMRLSGLLLVFLALGHFGIQHVVNDVHDLSLAFVAERWGSLGWRLYDAALLALALIHGLNGVRIVSDDYVRHPVLRNIVRWGILIAGAFLIIVGTWTIIGGVSPLPS